MAPWRSAVPILNFFLSFGSLQTVLRQSALIGLIAFGMVFLVAMGKSLWPPRRCSSRMFTLDSAIIIKIERRLQLMFVN
jgi:hypothetical protein